LCRHDALLVQPGTHCKWVEMTAGRVAGFTTAMTGELFALLRKHGLLSAQLGSEVRLGQAFLDGVEEGRKRDLAASLFGIRASPSCSASATTIDAASFASGLLIGSDVAARLETQGHDTIHILADPRSAASMPPRSRRMAAPRTSIDSHAAFAAGIIAIGARNE
jgi:2-dehydro-3-deoxygalactonokinase